MLPAHLEKQLSDLDPRELGPHAAALLAELRRAARAGMPLTVLLLAATLVDVVAATRRPLDGFAGAVTSFCTTKGRQTG